FGSSVGSVGSVASVGAVGAPSAAANGADVGSSSIAVGVGLADDRSLGTWSRLRRRTGAIVEILRPFAFTASVIPVLAGGALAAVDNRFAGLPFLAALVGAVLLQAGTNIVNEIYDVRQGIDTITSPRASHAILKGRLSERA